MIVSSDRRDSGAVTLASQQDPNSSLTAPTPARDATEA